MQRNRRESPPVTWILDPLYESAQTIADGADKRIAEASALPFHVVGNLKKVVEKLGVAGFGLQFSQTLPISLLASSVAASTYLSPSFSIACSAFLENAQFLSRRRPSGLFLQLVRTFDEFARDLVGHLSFPCRPDSYGKPFYLNMLTNVLTLTRQKAGGP